MARKMEWRYLCHIISSLFKTGLVRCIVFAHSFRFGAYLLASSNILCLVLWVQPSQIRAEYGFCKDAYCEWLLACPHNTQTHTLIACVLNACPHNTNTTHNTHTTERENNCLRALCLPTTHSTHTTQTTHKHTHTQTHLHSCLSNRIPYLSSYPPHDQYVCVCGGWVVGGWVCRWVYVCVMFVCVCVCVCVCCVIYVWCVFVCVLCVYKYI
jgi:hypothetical protein